VVLVRVGDYEENIITVEDLEQFCRKLREELHKSECQYNSWYIRVPPERLFALLKKAYMKYAQGVLNASDVIAEFLDEYKLSRSLARTITPTLSSLGLTTAGKFTAVAIELGKLLHEGRLEEAKEKLRVLFAKNCVLKEILERAADCSELEKSVAIVLTGYGKSIRFDELKYTTELLRMAHPKCENCDMSCVTRDKIIHCIEKIIQLSAPHMRELFEKLDITLLPEHLEYVRKDGFTFSINVRGTDKIIGKILIGPPIESVHLAQLKSSLAKLDENIAEGVYEVYVKIIPILEGEEKCKSMKLLLEVVRGDLERVSKIVKISS